MEELRRWQLDTQFDGLKMQDVWFSDAAKTAYPILAWLFPYIASLEHCTAECEREFSVLARMLTQPLRRGRMVSTDALRRMPLQAQLQETLNIGIMRMHPRWSLLPH